MGKYPQIIQYLMLFYENKFCYNQYILRVADSNKHQIIKVRLISLYINEHKDRILNAHIEGIRLSESDYENLVDNILKRCLNLR